MDVLRYHTFEIHGIAGSPYRPLTFDGLMGVLNGFVIIILSQDFRPLDFQT